MADDRQQAAEDLSIEWGGTLSPEQLLDCPFLLIGSHDDIADQLAARSETFGVTYWTIFENSWEQFAPVMSTLA